MYHMHFATFALYDERERCMYCYIYVHYSTQHNVLRERGVHVRTGREENVLIHVPHQAAKNYMTSYMQCNKCNTSCMSLQQYMSAQVRV
jgi:hypothetical protein